MLHRLPSDITAAQIPASRSVLDGDTLRIFVLGRWTLPFLSEAYAAAGNVDRETHRPGKVEIDCSSLEMLDTAGSLALLRLQENLATGGIRPDFVRLRNEHRILLAEIARVAGRSEALPPRQESFFIVAQSLYNTLTAILRDAVRLTMFLGETAAGVGRALARPKTFRWISLVNQVHQTGFNAVPIVSLVCFLIGGVIMQQGAQQLRAFGAETLSIDMLGILVLREVGVILAAVMVAGRSASAFTAQIGTMKMREEIDAMRTIGIDPIETLVVPRVLGLIVALPLLVFVADMMALAGGAAMAKFYLDLDLPIFLQRLNSAVADKHFYVGLIKAPFAALVIGLVGCLEGLSVKGSAESVGSQVTSAVVKAIFLVLVLDGIFAIFLSASGF